MKTLKSIIFILCICSVCSKVVIHTYRHFSPPPAVATIP